MRLRESSDGRQLVRVVRSVNELAPVDKLNRTVAIVIHLYTLAHEFRQSHVHIPSLDHAPVDVHDHTLVVKRVHLSDLVRLVARAAHCDHQPVLTASHQCVSVLLRVRVHPHNHFPVRDAGQKVL